MQLTSNFTGIVLGEDLSLGIVQNWPESEFQNAADIAALEGAGLTYAVNDSLIKYWRHGTLASPVNGIPSSLELSVGPFQVNVLTCPESWDWPTLFNPWVNAWAAHEIWKSQGYGAWFHSAKKLGLI